MRSKTIMYSCCAIFCMAFAAVVLVQTYSKYSHSYTQTLVLQDLGPWDYNKYVGTTEVPPEPEIPWFTEDDAALIGRIGHGIVKWHSLRNHKHWWNCGHLVPEAEQDYEAMLWAMDIVRETKEVNMHSDRPFTPWGVVGIIANESNFDPCALGPHPRKQAYALGLMTPNRRSLSHTREDILSVLQDPRMQKSFRRTGVDIGAMQLLSRFWPDNYPKALMIDRRTGIEIGVQEMFSRGRAYRTSKPWLHWRGINTVWYKDKIEGIARYMGAKPAELR